MKSEVCSCIEHLDTCDSSVLTLQALQIIDEMGDQLKVKYSQRPLKPLTTEKKEELEDGEESLDKAGTLRR